MPGDVKQKKVHCKEWLGRFVLAVIVSFLALMGWIGWYLRDYEPFTARSYYPARSDSHEVSFIEGNADITLPASAHDIYAYTTGFQEMSIKVRFSMNADDPGHALCGPVAIMGACPGMTLVVRLIASSEWRQRRPRRAAPRRAG
jgi:hypothetical protein